MTTNSLRFSDQSHGVVLLVGVINSLMCKEMPPLRRSATQHWSPLVATSDSISPIWEEGCSEGGLRHILCPYMGMKFTRSGESSHWSWWMGRRAEGAAKVYIRRERGSRWCEIHSKQIPTEERTRKGISLTAFYTFWHRAPRIICWIPSKGGLKKAFICIISFTFPLLSFCSGRDGLLSASLCWTMWIWTRKILFTLSLRIATVPPWEWKTACGRTTRRCTSMQSGGYLPSLATVSSHLYTLDNMCVHENLKCVKSKHQEKRARLCV